MNDFDNDIVRDYVETNIGIFHQKRIASLNRLQLKTILKKKNPYLFKAKYLLTSEQIIKSLTDAFLSSNEETIFGEWLEGLALFINSIAYNGRKSSAKGIDLEFEDDNRIYYIISIKSGPNWGNSSQIAKMRSDFLAATRTLRTSNSHINVRAVNGCCYGQDLNPNKTDYLKYCGQLFWFFLSGKNNLYLDIIEPLGYRAREKNDEFLSLYSNMINSFTRQFIDEFCMRNGQIDWEKLVEFNSKSKTTLTIR